MAWASVVMKSETLHMPVEAEMLIPQPGIERLEQADGYKVMVLLHGAFNDRTEWLLKSQIADLVKELPVLVFMPSGKNSFYVNTANGYDYMDFITREIPEWLRTGFRVSEKREDWLIAGNSMGGYGALCCGLHCPERFGNIASFSGALDVIDMREHDPLFDLNLVFGTERENLVERGYDLYTYCHKVEKSLRPRIYMNCGRQDSLYDMSVRFLEEIRGEYDVFWSDGDGAHDFSYWNEKLKELIPWFLERQVSV